ncbi:DUF1211 domain-containing protein [Micromonospora globispora]|uniref:DUF1211 domain-containing protein n=2 Tax=Micromonospora globispora TaxID=1450148 RepID=A0A317JZ37_9ACTN|nr:TMEM175 family protein [Micromonospora globispora]PWU46057.1 DUF1211 domain-containing protein [Micromonospora globispora]PWU60843.1 DUF1211 domain-containing protein [Micromonospora globispora]RQW95699.1 DUF1211 domain-containing protein [Micromonospora globispora]
MSVFTQKVVPADPDVRMVAAERLTFFADAVIAIAITLLALELPMPAGTTNAELLHSVAEHRGEYIAFVISFVVIGAHWDGHHRVFRYVTSLGGRLSRLSMYWLLMQVVTPFATKVLTGDGAFQVRFGFYAAVQAAAGLLFLLMVREIRRNHLYRLGTPPGMFTNAIVRTGVLAGAFLVSIPMSFFTAYSYLCWIAMPVVTAIVMRILRRRAASITTGTGSLPRTQKSSPTTP